MSNTVILLWALKRSAIARLQAIASGQQPCPPGCEPLLAVGVQIEPVMPADTDRICIYGTPMRATRRQTTAENVTAVESVSMELRLRVFQPGEQDEDVGDVDQLLSQYATAVAKALLDGIPLFQAGMGNINLSAITQWPTAVAAYPEPSVTGLASLFFTADLVTS